MEKIMVWYGLFLKMCLKQKIYWFSIALMLLLAAIVEGVRLPDSENVKIGIWAENSRYAEQLMSALADKEPFVFSRYESRQEIYGEVTAGQIECGFIFAEDFDRALAEGKLDKKITYICTPLTAKGAIAKETIYAECLRLYSGTLLAGSEEDVYGDTDESRLADLQEKNRYYLSEGELFQTTVEQVEVSVPETESTEENRTYPLQGTMALFVMLCMFLAYGKKYEQDTCNLLKTLNSADKRKFEWLHMLAAGTLPAFVGMIAIIVAGESRGVIKEMGLMALFLVLSCVWISLAGKVIKGQEGFYPAVTLGLMCHILLCPVFLDFSQYVSAIEYIRYLTPLGIYLGI